MTAPDPQHIDAVARALADRPLCAHQARQACDGVRISQCFEHDAADLLDSTDPAVHAAMLDALTRHGVLERVPVCHEPGFTHLVQVDWQEVAP